MTKNKQKNKQLPPLSGKTKGFGRAENPVVNSPGKIAWNFHLIETEHQYYKCSLDKLLRYVQSLASRFEGKTIIEIENENKGRSTHRWKPDEFIKADKELQEIINKKNLAQYQIFQLQLSAKVRIWGTLDGNIFNIICIDEEHKGYVVHKKHT